MDVIKSLFEVLELVIACMSLILIVCIYILQTKKESCDKILAKQVAAYYYEEQEAIKWIAELQQSNQTRKIQTELRNRADQNNANVFGRPEMQASKAKSYL